MARFDRLAYFILLSAALQAYSLPLSQSKHDVDEGLSRRGCVEAIKGFCQRIGIVKKDSASVHTADVDFASDAFDSRPASSSSPTDAYPPIAPMVMGNPGHSRHHSYPPNHPSSRPHQQSNSYTSGKAGTYNQAGSSSGTRNRGMAVTKGVNKAGKKPSPGQKGSKRPKVSAKLKAVGKKVRKLASTRLAQKAAKRKPSGKTKASRTRKPAKSTKLPGKESTKAKSPKKAATPKAK